MSTYIGPDGRRVVDPGKLPRTEVRRLRKAAKQRPPRSAPPSPPVEPKGSQDDT